MKRSLSLVLTVFCTMYLVGGCSHKNSELSQIPDLANLTVTHSMKGWELYTWPEGNTWKFSFLIGTNRIKSLSEVISSNSAEVLIRVTGVDSVKMVLNKFPQGEVIMLIGQGWLQNTWQGQYGNLQLPPQNIIDQINSFATQKSVMFSVAN